MIVRFFLMCAVCLAALFAAPAGAQVVRQLPEGLVVTTMKANGGAAVVLGERKVVLSPAAQVRGQNNLIIVPASLYGTHRVAYKRDHQGLVHRIWILTDSEYRALIEKQ